MISAGTTVDQNKKGQLVLCGEGSGMDADASCKAKVDKEYTRSSSDLTGASKAIFDDSFNLIYGNRYDACFIDRGDGVSIDNLDSDEDALAHKKCVVKFVEDNATVKFEGAYAQFYRCDGPICARGRWVRLRVAGSMVAIPTKSQGLSQFD